MLLPEGNLSENTLGIFSRRLRGPLLLAKHLEQQISKPEGSSRGFGVAVVCPWHRGGRQSDDTLSGLTRCHLLPRRIQRALRCLSPALGSRDRCYRQTGSRPSSRLKPQVAIRANAIQIRPVTASPLTIPTICTWPIYLRAKISRQRYTRYGTATRRQ